MFFRYTALNPENQKLSGTIEAENEADARKRLNELDLSIVALAEIAGAGKAQAGISGRKFYFEAIDQKGKKVMGTVDALATDEAFQKLSSEYRLDVQVLYREGASKADMENSSRRLKALKVDFGLKQKTAKGDVIDVSKKKERLDLLKKVDQTIKTIQAFLQEYGQDMKPDERDKIQGYINQLYRIKDSTNLKHIQQTCEQMLSYLEKEEIFLRESRRIKEEASLKMESRELLESFKNTGLKKKIEIRDVLRFFSKLPFLMDLGEAISGRFLLKDPEAQDIRLKVKVLRGKIWQFRKLAFKNRNTDYAAEAKETIMELQEEKRRAEMELNALKMRRRGATVEQEEAYRHKKFGGISLLVGFLLAFYLIFYFVAFPFQYKKIPLTVTAPETFVFSRVPMLSGLLLLLFFLHIALTLRHEFFAKKAYSPFFLYPAIGLLYLVFLYNFVM